MDCQFCNNSFSTKTSLNNHQKTAKYCLSLRNISNDTNFICEGCDTKFLRSYHLERHRKTCKVNGKLYSLENDFETLKIKFSEKENLLSEKERYIVKLENLIQEQKQTIKDLQDKLENIALKAVSRSTTTKNTQINNYIQNLQPVTDEYLLDNVKHLSIDHILRGPEGYADYALEYPLKNSLICVDYSRRKVKFKDKDGNVITDPEMSNLATKFFNSIKDKNKDLIVEYGEKLKENFGDELDTIVKIFDYKSAVDNGSSGNKTEFQHDFVKHMCSKTIKEE